MLSVLSFEVVEIENWLDVLRFTFADEAIWAICDALDGKGHISKRNLEFMQNLLETDLTDYAIGGMRPS